MNLWTGKQIFSLLIKPNQWCPINANLRTKGRAYTSDEEMCINDSCKFHLCVIKLRMLSVLKTRDLLQGQRGNEVEKVSVRVNCSSPENGGFPKM